MSDGVVAALATTGAPMASSVPVRVGEVETMRVGLALIVVSPLVWVMVRGQPWLLAEAAGVDAEVAAPGC